MQRPFPASASLFTRLSLGASGDSTGCVHGYISPRRAVAIFLCFALCPVPVVSIVDKDLRF